MSLGIQGGDNSMQDFPSQSYITFLHDIWYSLLYNHVPSVVEQTLQCYGSSRPSISQYSSTAKIETKHHVTTGV